MSELGRKIDGVDKAFNCPDCGDTLSIPNSAPIALYCSCGYERSWSVMSAEERFYAKLARDSSEIASKAATVEQLKILVDEVHNE